MKIAIVEDEKEYRDSLDLRLQCCFKKKGFELQTYLFEGLKAFSERNIEVDFIFLDIFLDGEECFKHLNKYIDRSLRNKIIFVTSQEYLVFEACHLKPFDFIRKNMIDSELEVIVINIISYYNEENKEFEFDIDSKIIKICANDVMYFEVSGNNLNIITKKNIKLSCRCSLKRIQEIISTKGIVGFVKINKSTIINTRYCTDIKKDVLHINGELTLAISINSRSRIRNEVIQQIVKMY